MQINQLSYHLNKYKAFIIGGIVSILSFVWYIYKGSGFFVLSDDFNNQAIPFLEAMHRILREGVDTFSWDLDLGTSSLQGYSFYGLGSPFVWVTALLPQQYVRYSLGWILIIKYYVAYIAAYYYIKPFVKKNDSAIIGALLYAFSGFQSINLVFYHFHDATAFYPLLLIGVERLICNHNSQEERRAFAFFSAVVWINCSVNYYFFVQSVILLFIYYVIRIHFCKKAGERLKYLIKLIAGGTLGVGMSFAIFLPSILYLLGNKRIYGDVQSISRTAPISILFSKEYLLLILKGILFPAEAMMNNSSAVQWAFDSTGSYLPFVGVVMVIAFLIKQVVAKSSNTSAKGVANDAPWLKYILILLLVMSFFPVTNALFILFQIVYQRWWYGLALMMALASAIVIDDHRSYPVKTAAVVAAAIILAYLFVIFFTSSADGEPFVFNRDSMLTLAGITLTAALLIVLIEEFSSRHKRMYSKVILWCVSISCVLTTMYAEHEYRENGLISTEDYISLVDMSSQLPMIGDAWRYRNYDNTVIIHSSEANTDGLSGYTSTASNSLTEFDSLFDFYEIDRRLNKNTIAGLPELLGGKFEFQTHDIYLEERLQNKYDNGELIKEIDADGKRGSVISMPACPIGYRVTNAISVSELMKLPLEERGIALLQAAVVPDEELESIDVSCIKMISSEDSCLMKENIEAWTEINNENAAIGFERNSRGFRCLTDQEGYYYFSVPFDAGWDIRVDEVSTTPINSGGMMLLHVDSGKHTVQATYHTPGFRTGLWITLISWGVFLYLLLRSMSGRFSGKENIEF